jgi:hypothetical protein
MRILNYSPRSIKSSFQSPDSAIMQSFMPLRGDCAGYQSVEHFCNFLFSTNKQSLHIKRIHPLYSAYMKSFIIFPQRLRLTNANAPSKISVCVSKPLGHSSSTGTKFCHS